MMLIFSDLTYASMVRILPQRGPARFPAFARASQLARMSPTADHPPTGNS